MITTAALAAAITRGRGPAALASNAAPDRFSAARAIAALATILGDGAPHPVGSPAHDAVRDRVAAEFRRLGYDTSLQQRFACNAHATCAPVANIVARLPGDSRADILMLSAHYDSVGAGPGASDDGAGVATLVEVARAIRHEHFRNAVLFVVTDGEEDGLLGAEAFVADPAMPKPAAAINVENRGTSGRSSLFETSRHNRWLMPLIARSLPRPYASSFFFNLYELLPNDTDLSVFKRAGIAGINFAAIRDVSHYHTPLDDLRHVSPSTVQDHGDHVLGMTRALANADLRQSTGGDAVYFDVLSFAMVWWPQSYSLWIALGALVMLLIGAAMHIRRGHTRARAITFGVLSFFLTLALAAIAGALLTWLASLRSAGAIWVAQPGPSIAAMWLIGWASAIVCATLFRPRAGFEGLFIGHALCWTAMSFALAVILPGGAYLALVPAVAFAICALFASPEVSVLVTSAVAAIVWFPILLSFYDLIGRVALIAIAMSVALVSTAFTPLVSVRTPVHRGLTAALIVAALACALMQLVLPPYAPESPRRINVQYVDDNGTARWLVDGSPPAAAPQLNLPPPQCEGTLAALRCRSPRGAPRLAVQFFAPDLISLRINGVVPPPPPPRFRPHFPRGWYGINVRGVSEAQIEIALAGNHPLDAVIIDRSFGVPAIAAPIVARRDAAPGVPSNEGDGTVVRRKTRL